MRSRLLVFVAALAAVLALAWASGGGAAARAEAPVGLHVAGGKLLERDGSPFVARGVNHAHTWYVTRTPTAIPAIKAAGANAVRVVLSSGHRWTKNDAADVSAVVSLCKTHRLICMLEVHDTTGYGEDSAAATLDQAVDYWIEVKSALAGQEDYVQLNIGNEPFGNGAVVSRWTAETSAAIKRLRAAGFRHNIVVDAPNWGQDWTSTMRDNAATVFAADPHANVMFSIHMYGVYGNSSAVQAYLQAFTGKGLPITVGEFGHDHSDGNVDEDAIMAETQRLGIGYYGWSWSGNGGGVEYLDLVTGFDPARLTPWGQRLVHGANGIKATAREAAVYRRTTPPPTTPPTTPPPGGRGCTAAFKVDNAWQGGFQGSVAVKATSALKSWSTTFTPPPGVTVTEVWNGVVSRSGSVVTVRNADWNGSVAAGATVTYGFTGSGPAPSGNLAVACTGD